MPLTLTLLDLTTGCRLLATDWRGLECLGDVLQRLRVGSSISDPEGAETRNADPS
jgi:hypothetical protein